MRKLKITELNRISPEEFKEKNKTPLIVVLDNVRSLHNIGSVFRTSDAFLLESIYLCGITATPPNAEIHKTALGAEFTMSWTHFENTEEAINKLKKENYTIFAIEQVERSISLPDLKLPKGRKFAIVLGNDVKGIEQKIVDMCDAAVEIPQFGTKHSLNVSVATGIVIWDFFKQIKQNI